MDIERLLRSLNARSVRYVVIGATAFPVHGYARATLDVDFFIEPERGNAERVREALVEFGYDMTDVTVDDLLSKKILIREYRLQTDVHPFVKGVTFDEVWTKRVPGHVGKTPTAFASLDDLIVMKKAAARPKDLEDLRVLEELKGRNDRPAR
jgi:predicted nucleotidyltransferase